MFKSGPNYSKLRTNLRLCINRLKLLEKKKAEQALKARKDIADYIAQGKDDRARIRVEHIVREDYMVEGMEILELFCDLLLARFGLIEKMKEMDPSLEEAIASIIWATLRLSADIPEFQQVKTQLQGKYGKEYVEYCQGNKGENVNEKLQRKLSIYAPPKSLIENYMVEIARTYNVPFVPDPMAMEDVEEAIVTEDLLNFGDETKGGRGGSGGGGGGNVNTTPPPAYSKFPNPGAQPTQGQSSQPPMPQPFTPSSYPPPPSVHPPINAGYTGPFVRPPVPNSYPNDTGGASGGLAYPPPGGAISPCPPQQPTAPPTGPSKPPAGMLDLPSVPVDHNSVDLNLPDVPSSLPPGGASAGGNDIDFDDLTKRFEELKKKK